MDTEEFGANPPPPCAELQSYHGQNISGEVDTYIILLMEDILHPLIFSLFPTFQVMQYFFHQQYVHQYTSTIHPNLRMMGYIYSRKRTVNPSKRHRAPPKKEIVFQPFLGSLGDCWWTKFGYPLHVKQIYHIHCDEFQPSQAGSLDSPINSITPTKQ